MGIICPLIWRCVSEDPVKLGLHGALRNGVASKKQNNEGECVGICFMTSDYKNPDIYNHLLRLKNSWASILFWEPGSDEKL
jgi:hypothetical protein